MSEPTTEAGRDVVILLTNGIGLHEPAKHIVAIEAETRASLDVALLAEALFEARIGVPKDTPYLAGLLLPVIQRLWAEEQDA